VQVEYKKYAAGDTRAEDNLDNRERIAKIWVDIRDMKLAPLQRERFIYLMGNRWTGSDKVKIVCRQYNTYHENLLRANEILREIYWESKRAPSTNTSAIRNPYRREFLKKKLLGKTRAERLAKIEQNRLDDIKNREEVDAAEMGLQKQ
jgi:hypothetical protein